MIISINNKKGLFTEMKFTEFKKKIAHFPIFSTSHLNSLGGNQQVLRNQLTKWQKNGLVIKLRKGLYMLGDLDRMLTPSRLFLANHMYQPSYVSIEYALGIYDIIPERVYDVTSVSPKKTAVFENKFGRFIYQRIKANSFGVYKIIADENGYSCFIAEAEKALMDYCYLNMSLFKTGDTTVFESLRLQNLQSLKTRRIMTCAQMFNSNRLMKITDFLIRYIKEVRT
jgi:predicted transcriptional regulator of viral defense system